MPLLIIKEFNRNFLDFGKLRNIYSIIMNEIRLEIIDIIEYNWEDYKKIFGKFHSY